METIQVLFIVAAFLIGFIIAWAWRTANIFKIKKELKSTKGYLESERLMKETLNRENLMVHQQRLLSEEELNKKLKEAEALNKFLDESILLLQQSNEETEALLQAGEPVIHDLKKKLIEANNTITRLKALQSVK